MLDNHVKRSLKQGSVSIGTMMFEFNTTGIGRIAANAGSEFQDANSYFECLLTLLNVNWGGYGNCRCEDFVRNR